MKPLPLSARPIEILLRVSAIIKYLTDCMNPLSGAELFGAAYISKASGFVRTTQIAAIVAESRRRNANDALSGFLIKAGQNFLQYLEGPRAEVVACLRRIESDPRHYDMRILALGATHTRRFSDWSMGYFVGDVGGCERFERSLTTWHGSDRSLLEEVWRIAAAAQTGSASVERPELVVGPFEVLLRRRV